MIAGRLLRELVLIQYVTKLSPTITAHIVRTNNLMSDNDPRWFESIFNTKDVHVTGNNFLVYVTTHHKSKKEFSYKFFLSSELSTNVINRMRNKQSTLVLWKRIPNKRGIIRKLGANTVPTWISSHPWTGRKMIE